MKKFLKYSIYLIIFLFTVFLTVKLSNTPTRTVMAGGSIAEPCDNNTYYDQYISSCNPFMQSWVTINKPTYQYGKDCSGTIEGNASIKQFGQNYYYVRNPNAIWNAENGVASMRYNIGQKPNSGGTSCGGNVEWKSVTTLVAPEIIPNYSGSTYLYSRILYCVNSGSGCAFVSTLTRKIGPFNIQPYVPPAPVVRYVTHRTYCESCNNPRIYMEWTSENITWLRVSRSDNGGNYNQIVSYSGSSIPNSYTDSNIVSGNSYKYIVIGGNETTATSSFELGTLTASDCSGPTGNIQADKTIVPLNGTTTISWDCTNCFQPQIDANGVSTSWISIDHGNNVFSGSNSIANLTSDMIYTMSCTSSMGCAALIKSVRVQVKSPPAVTLTATPSIINPGSTSTLSWTSTGATSLSIDQGISTVTVPNGSKSIQPTSTTTYTITARDDLGQTATAQATVTISNVNLPVSVTLTANPNSIDIGGESTLSWTSNNADFLQIDQGIGTVNVPSGSIVVRPSLTTTYTITARDNSGGVATSSATIIVNLFSSRFKGLFIANEILINRERLDIIYDPRIAVNPPPGFAELIMPIFGEVAP